MKIAICFSGQLRGSWLKCVESWKQTFSQHEVYYFGHTWTTRSAPNFIKVTKGLDDIETIDPDEIQKLKRELPQINLKVEEQVVFPAGLDQALHDVNYQSQFYSVMQSANLKRKVEIEENHTFDLCVRARWDTMFDEQWNVPEPTADSAQVIHLGFDTNGHRMRVGDIYWQAPSEEFDLMCDFYRHFHRHPKEYFNMNNDLHYGPEHVFAYYLKECGLNLSQIYPPVKLVRPKPEHVVGSGDYETL